MQTFLPYPDFKQSAKSLDNKRLGKQRVEAWQIYQSLTIEDYGWKNHPIVKMWKGYEKALLFYGYEISDEWKSRGFKDIMKQRFMEEIGKKYFTDRLLKSELPYWFSIENFHASHRSNLLRKDITWYGQFGWTETPDLEYVWFNPEKVNKDVSERMPHG